jgi:hypothetical protein
MLRGKRISPQPGCEEDRPVWGIRVDKSLSDVYQAAAAVFRVPDYVLVSFALTRWLEDNLILLTTKAGSKIMSQTIGEYRRRHTKESPRAMSKAMDSGTDDLTDIREMWSVRGVRMETILRVRILAEHRGIRISRLMDEMVEREWEVAGDEAAKPGESSRISKRVVAALRHAVRNTPPNIRGKQEADDTAAKVLTAVAGRAGIRKSSPNRVDQ